MLRMEHLVPISISIIDIDVDVDVERYIVISMVFKSNTWLSS